MDLHKAQYLTRTLMQQYGLVDAGWTFEYSKRTTNLGHCSYQHKIIYLSISWTYTGDEVRVLNTIRHEIAHALVGSGHSHDNVWRRKALELGCTGDACTAVRHEKPQLRYILSCPTHGEVHQMHKITRSSYVCRKCPFILTRTYNPNFASQYGAIEADRPR